MKKFFSNIGLTVDGAALEAMGILLLMGGWILVVMM